MSALCQKRTLPVSFDHVIGTRGEPRRDVDPKLFGRLEVDHEFEFGGLIDRQIGGRGTVENAPASPNSVTRPTDQRGNGARSNSPQMKLSSWHLASRCHKRCTSPLTRSSNRVDFAALHNVRFWQISLQK